MLPTIYTVSPYVVVANSLNLTAIEVGVAQSVVELFAVVLVVVAEVILLVGQEVLVAVLHRPLAEPPEHINGRFACREV